jgi:hypothetical protein
MHAHCFLSWQSITTFADNFNEAISDGTFTINTMSFAVQPFSLCKCLRVSASLDSILTGTHAGKLPQH